MELIGAIDQGTTSTRFIVFNKTGKIISVFQEQYHFDSPSPGWAETDPYVILNTVISTINSAHDDLVSKGIDPHALKWIGLTNQRESLVVWDKQGNPVYNAILWLDNRTEGYLDGMKKDLVKNNKYDQTFGLIKQLTGLRFSSYFTATKLHWMLTNVPGLIDRVLKGEICAGTVDSWIIYKLLNDPTLLQGTETSESAQVEPIYHMTDVTNASRTLMFNIMDLEWDKMLIDMLVLGKYMEKDDDFDGDSECPLLGLTADDIIACLPKVFPSQHCFGSIKNDKIKFVSDGISLTIGGVCGDQQSALIGHLGFDVMSTKVTFGTGAFVLSNIGGKKSALKRMDIKNPLLTTILCQFEGDFWTDGDGEGEKPKLLYAMEGSVSNAGTTITQLMKLGIAETPQHLDRLAEKVYVRSEQPTNGYHYPRSSCVVVPAFNGLFGSRWDDTARCIISGVSYATGREHICRAALEGIAYQTSEILEVITGDKGAHKAIMVDGGVTNSDVFLKVMSNISSTELIKSDMTEATAFGAAIIAGLTSGFYKSFEDVESNVVEIKKRYKPEMGKQEWVDGWKRWDDAIGRCHGLSEFD